MNGHIILFILAVAFVYAAWAYFHPFRACPRCNGSGTNPLSTVRRNGKCRKCNGSRQVKTRGSQVLHRAVRSGRSSIRDRNR